MTPRPKPAPLILPGDGWWVAEANERGSVTHRQVAYFIPDRGRPARWVPVVADGRSLGLLTFGAHDDHGIVLWSELTCSADEAGRVAWEIKKERAWVETWNREHPPPHPRG